MRFERKPIQKDIEVPNDFPQEYPIWNRNQLEDCRRMLDGCLNRLQITDSEEEVNRLRSSIRHYLGNLFQQTKYRFYKTKKYITFVGSRQTPDDVIAQNVTLLNRYISQGYIVRSGNAEGFDLLVSCHAIPGLREIYLPYKNFNLQYLGGIYNDAYVPNTAWPNYQKAKELVQQFHPLKDKVPEKALPYLIRDVYQVLGLDLKTPSKKVICWTPDGAQTAKECTKKTGGTAMVIRIADVYGIPVENLNRKKEKS